MLSALILCGCAMNGLFLYPDQLSSDKKQHAFYDHSGDRPLLAKLGEEFQPVFYDSTGASVELECALKSFVFPNRSGDSLHGWILTPRTEPNGTTLFYLHGNAGNLYSQYGLMMPFVKRGYTVFMFDYSGFGHSQGKAKRKQVYTDALDAFAFMKEQLQPQSVVVYGQSLGGHLTASIGNTIQHDVQAFVIEGAFSSHDEVAANRSGLGGFARMMVREIYSGVDSIPAIVKPKLIIHSHEDAVVSYYMGERLFDAASEPKDFYRIDKRHILGPLYYADSIVFKLEELLDQD